MEINRRRMVKKQTQIRRNLDRNKSKIRIQTLYWTKVYANKRDKLWRNKHRITTNRSRPRMTQTTLSMLPKWHKNQPPWQKNPHLEPNCLFWSIVAILHICQTIPINSILQSILWMRSKTIILWSIRARSWKKDSKRVEC